MPRIAILGGGIAGLAAALRARELAAEHRMSIEISLYEREARVGGCVQTVRENGFVMELGPDSLLVDKPAAASLLQRLNLRDAVLDIRAESKGARIVHRGRLRPIPPQFRLFSPTSLPALLRSGIFSPLGITRAAMEAFIPARQDRTDESVASFVTRRFGREVLDRLAQPLIGGIYSGDPQRLGMRATLPQFLELERRYGSLLRGMQNRPANSAPVRLASLERGIGSIVETLQSQVADQISTGADVVRIRRESGVWTITFADRSSTQADAVVCALPAHAAANLLRESNLQIAELLERIRYNSIATVNLVYSARDARLPRATGFVVPFVERRGITAATFATQKYRHRAPDGSVLVRAFIGGALQPHLVQHSDEELAGIAHRELAQLCGVSVGPQRTIVARWNRLLPEYGVGHVELVDEIERRAATLGGLAFAGSAYRGVGIPDCIATGEAGAESAFGYIRR